MGRGQLPGRRGSKSVSYASDIACFRLAIAFQRPELPRELATLSTILKRPRMAL